MSIYKEDTNTTLYSEFSSEKEYLAMLESAIEQSEVGFLIADAEGKVLKVNQGQINITDQIPEYNLGRNMREVEIDDGSPSATVMVVERKKPVKIEQRLTNGRSYLVYSRPLYIGSKLKYILSNLLDTTEITQTIEAIREDNKRLSLQLTELQNQMDPQKKIIHQSRIMRQLILLCDKVAQFDCGVLLQGESGVGKEKIAEYIFEKSTRREKPFIKINCAAIPEHLLESELFGYEAGAFTGADRKGKKGILEYADKGTLLLDEISELSLPLQAKMLRFLQSGEFYHVGGHEPLHSDVRVIAASNKKLADLVEREAFREDLYYRLNVIPIYIPPLRERREDIPLLVGHFTKKFNEKHSIDKSFEGEAVKLLCNVSYKGNVRELQNTVERILVLAEGETVSAGQVASIVDNIETEKVEEGRSLKEMVEQYETKILKKYMELLGTEEAVSKTLQISQSTVSRKLARSR